MPTRNQAPFIRAAIASVLAQADPLPAGALELVVADGASSDGTPEILAALAAQHPGVIHWVSEPDRGPADAVNKAVARARGAVVGWLNSDDLYAPGAAARAQQALQARPELVMVYGEGDHVDIDGRFLEHYPTRGPGTPLSEWADGCHICQPTAFFRREAFTALGGLDRTLRVAFDYEFWLRLFKAYPERVGFVHQVQALSRLHEAGITLSMREQVALEAVAVIHRHLGPAPAHWMLTCVDEVVAAHPFHRTPIDIHAHLQALVEKATPHLQPGGADRVRDHIASHRALQLATDRFACTASADGWMAQDSEVRLWQGKPPVRLIRLHCRHVSPLGGALWLDIAAPDGERLMLEVVRPGPFVMELPVTDPRDDAHLVFHVHTRNAFVPAEVEPGSTDRRRLAFIVDHVEIL